MRIVSAGAGDLATKRVEFAGDGAWGGVDGAGDGIRIHAGDDAVAGLGDDAGETRLAGGTGEIFNLA